MIVDMHGIVVRGSIDWRVWERKKGTKEDMLSNRKFGQYFGFVHLNHALVDLVPCLDLCGKISLY